jgi:hypothetical protein
MKYFKIINENNKSCNGGNFDWTEYLPTKNDDESWMPGKWTPEHPVVMCKSGYHVMDANHLLDWANAQLYECEVIGAVADEDNDKYACRSIRLVKKIETWNDRNLRLFACWCVRQVWHLLKDERSKRSVEVAERYAIGEASIEELRVARAAAWAAAREAAWAAALAAASWAASWAARAAAREAARAAALAAAWDAALAAAWDAARDAQCQHLLEMLEIESEEE